MTKKILPIPLSKENKFCRKCGSVLIHTKVHLMYHPETGEPYYGNRWRCPKHNLFIFSHDDYNDYQALDWM